MATVTIYGASDDLIEVEGAITEEFNPTTDGEINGPNYLAFSDGTVLSVDYGQTGVWSVRSVHHGTADLKKVEAVGPDSDDYSDRVTLSGDIRWVVFGSAYRRAGVKASDPAEQQERQRERG